MENQIQYYRAPLKIVGFKISPRWANFTTLPQNRWLYLKGGIPQRVSPPGFLQKPLQKPLPASILKTINFQPGCLMLFGSILALNNPSKR